jgi:hypothetical protein
VELEIFYTAIFPDKEGVFFNESFFERQDNKLLKLLPDSGSLIDVIKVYDFDGQENEAAGKLRLISDIKTQRIVCYR